MLEFFSLNRKTMNVLLNFEPVPGFLVRVRLIKVIQNC